MDYTISSIFGRSLSLATSLVIHPPLQSLLLPLHLHQRLLLWRLILHTPLGINRKSLSSAPWSLLSDSVLPHAVGIKTSRDAWLTLERMFASESQARIVQIRYQLATLKKGALTHLLRLKNHWKNQNSSHVFFAGLLKEFGSLVTSITTRINPVSMNDLYGHLLTHEQRIETHHSSPDLSLAAVNVA